MKKLERLAIYEGFFHKLNLYILSAQRQKITEAISLIDDWSYAHRVGNGELTLAEQKACVEGVIEKMKDF